MNHDEDEDLCMFDPGSWHIALLCLLLAMVIMLAGLVLMEVM
jgi:hypothetical protein